MDHGGGESKLARIDPLYGRGATFRLDDVHERFITDGCLVLSYQLIKQLALQTQLTEPIQGSETADEKITTNGQLTPQALGRKTHPVYGAPSRGRINTG